MPFNPIQPYSVIKIVTCEHFASPLSQASPNQPLSHLQKKELVSLGVQLP